VFLFGFAFMVVGTAKPVKPEHSLELAHSSEPLDRIMPEAFDMSQFVA
jgi:hypothetical protein